MSKKSEKQELIPLDLVMENVWFDGNPVPPENVDIKVTHQTITANGIEIYTDPNGELNPDCNLTLHKIYGETTLHVLLDDRSYFTTEDEQMWNLGSDFNILLLINSKSYNDQISRAVKLTDVISLNNEIENSTIKSAGAYAGVIAPNEEWRKTIEGCLISNCNIYQTDLPVGRYQSSTIFNTVFTPAADVTIQDSAIYSSNIYGKKISLNDVVIRTSYVQVEDQLFADKLRLNQDNLKGHDNLYLMSSFDKTEIQILPGVDATLLRIDKDTVSLDVIVEGKKVHVMLLDFKARNYDFNDVFGGICLALFKLDDAITPTQDSICKYVTETVISRCDMIRLLDSAKGTLDGGVVKDNFKTKFLELADKVYDGS